MLLLHGVAGNIFTFLKLVSIFVWTRVFSLLPTLSPETSALHY